MNLNFLVSLISTKIIFRGIELASLRDEISRNASQINGSLLLCAASLLTFEGATDIQAMNYRLCIIMLSPYILFLFISNYRFNISV